MRPQDRPFISDIHAARAVLGTEPKFIVGAVHGTAAWYALRAYFAGIGSGPCTLPASGGKVIVAHDQSMPTNQVAYYYLEKNLVEHLSRLT